VGDLGRGGIGQVLAQDDELRALVTQAIKAHGGKEALKKYQAAQAKYKGDVDVQGVQAKVEGEIFVSYAGRMKNVIEVEVNNMKIKIQQGYDGKALWMDIMGMVQEIKDKDAIAEMQEGMYAEQVANLVDLEDKAFKLSRVGEMKIMGKDAVGIRVSKEGKRDVNLWLDKASHMLLKSEHRGKDPFGQQPEANEEKYYKDYKPVMGIQTPHTMEVHRDGQKLIAMELSDMRYHEKLDDTYFTKP